MTTSLGLDRQYQTLQDMQPNKLSIHARGSGIMNSLSDESSTPPSSTSYPNNGFGLESSNNENNQRFVISRQHSMKSSASEQRDSSTWTHTGLAGSTGLSEPHKLARQGSSKSLARSKSSPPEDTSDSSSIIEEKRKKPCGEGYTIHRYRRGRMLGKGGFAQVFLCTALDTNKDYAVKIVSKSNLVKARARQKLQAEIKIHRTLKHQHVCEYKHFFEDRNNCYILLELCENQSMNELIKRRKRLTEPEAAFFMSQLLQAVRYMHDNNVIHRDLKLGNLFLDKSMHVKVGDLGLATKVEDKDEKRKTICGTPNYIAPEVIQSDKTKRGHSFEVDIWSMGVILYTILVGKPPYEAKDVKATYQRILSNEYSFPSHLKISETAKDLIQSMLQSNPRDRPSIDEIEAHPFLVPHMIPSCLPSSVLHVAPKWHLDEYGDIEFGEGPAAVPLHTSKAPQTSTNLRKPFTSRDPNSSRASSANSVKRSDRETIDVQRIVKNAISLAGSGSSRSRPSSPAFQIFDEASCHGPTDSRPILPSMKPPTSRPPTVTDSLLVARTKAISIAETMPGNTSSASSALSSGEFDMMVLQRMIDRLDTVLEITESRKGSYRLSSPRSLSIRHGAPTWVTRYVDYTSKYGLGFLLNDGSSGVYFNDSTKAVLEAKGEHFKYIERRKVDDLDYAIRRHEPVVETHTLSSYPDSLKKKVTLLKHFRNYLIEQQNKVDEEGFFNPSQVSVTSLTELVYVKKWVRTKHAILFRLSDSTVQVVFYDESELLLTPDERYITYVDKAGKRTTHHFSDELVGSSVEIEKRLKYTRDIMNQLITGQKR